MAAPDVTQVPRKTRTARPEVRPETTEAPVTVHLTPYHVVLLDDDDHTYDYVIEMLMRIFGHSMARAYAMACEVDARGRVVVDTTTRERAELKRDQITSYGPDWRIEYSRSSMQAVVEEAE